MSARVGRLMVPAVLRPLAERVADLVRPRRGERCLDALCDGGVMAAVLARAVGPAGSVLAVDEDAGAVDECREQAEALRLAWLRAECRVLGAGTRPEFDVVTSLLTLPWAADPGSLLRALADARTGATARLAVAVWSRPHTVPHEEAVADALSAARGSRPHAVDRAFAFSAPGALERCASDAGVARCEVHVLRDVVRFNGPDHLWAALVDDRPSIAGPPLEPAAAAESIARVGARLAHYAATDGTLVIPVELLVLTA
jgi:SAM-dependent methyltransferase